MTILSFFNALLPILQSILILGGLIGGAIAGISLFKSTRSTGIVKLQIDTIETMQAQIDSLKEQNAHQEKKIAEQDFKLQAVQDVLGIEITMEGEHVVIKDVKKPDTTRHVVKRPPKKTEDEK